MKVISWTAKCQSKTIREQYEAGVRCFDLRVKFTAQGELKVAHGLVEYKITEEELMEDLKFLNEQGDCYVRVLHEVRSASELTAQRMAWFQRWCFKATRLTKVYFFCGRNLVNWNIDYPFPRQELAIEDWYGSVKSRLYGKVWPWLWAKLNPIKFEEWESDKEVLLVDFV